MSTVEDAAHCAQIVQQPSAVSKAVARADFLVIPSALQECMADDEIEDEDITLFGKFFLSFA